MQDVHIVHGAFVHTMYWEQLHSCPPGFRYDLASNGAHVAMKADLRERAFASALRDRARRTVGRIRNRTGMPNLRLVRTRAALAHSWQYPLVCNRPWVIDFEDAAAMVGYAILRSIPRRLLRGLLASPRCRALLPWTDAARKTVVAELGQELDAKMQVLLPAIAPRSGAAPGGRGRRLLFVGSAFVPKGGVVLLRAFAIVRRQLPDATLDLVSFVPASFRAEAGSIPGVTVHTRLPPERLGQLFASARALVAPFATDTLGYVVLEAFAHATPAVVTRHFALPELVTDGVTGLVVPTSCSLFDEHWRRRFPSLSGGHDQTHGHPILDELREPPSADVEALAAGMASALSDGPRLEEMGAAALAETQVGRFSHARRRERLLAVYSGAAE
jgi:glycosyltransferase involved in cell wall biosynthesis